jgi:phage-related protein
LAFPENARRQAGFQLGKVQSGFHPDDWKPFGQIGPGTREIRLRDEHGIFRVMYVAKFEEAIYIRHCFEKKTRATTAYDKAVAEARYCDIIQQRGTP